jgi:hypothetical protein
VNLDAPTLDLHDGEVMLASQRVSDHLAPGAAAWVRATTV